MAAKKKKKTTKKKVTKKTTKKVVTKKTTKKTPVKKSTTKKTTQTKKNTAKKVVKKAPVKNTPKKKTTKNNEENRLNKILKLLKRKKNKYIYYSIIFLIVIVYLSYLLFYLAPTPIINKVSVDENNNMNISFLLNKYRSRNKIYCIYKLEEKKPSIKDKDWVLTKNNTCSFPIEKGAYYAYLKNEDNQIFEVSASKTTGRIFDIKTVNTIYLPLNGTQKLDIKYDYVGYLDETVKYSYNRKIISVKDNIITGLNEGNTTLQAKIMDEKIDINVIVTKLIVNRKKDGFDLSKKNLGCNTFTKEQNDLLDQILKTKIENVGYKTRAGVVEAARFLTLDFPYRITYFYENGRQTTNNVDGEGRYYHTGLYLSSSKYSSLTGTKKGPAIWGCPLYSVPDKKTDINGLDCSGFISWALLNGGFDVKDVGAGWSNNLDLTDYGTVKKVSSINYNQIKVGDLLHSTALGGHIGMIIGVDSSYFYIAQAIWYNPVGVVITKIQKNRLSTLFPHVVLMDKYYKNDGNLTNMW